MSNLLTRLRKGAAATAVGALFATPLALTASGTAASAAEPHVDNPYAGATQYVNLTWSQNVEDEAQSVEATDPGLAEKMRAVKYQPTGVWMDRISAIDGNFDGPGLQHHLDQALLQKQDSTPIVLNLVIYNLPGRDCYALASNGELPATPEALERYKNEYIDVIADILAEPQYSSIRISATIEPDSLPNLTTNMHEPACVTSEPYYLEGVTYALDELSAIPNVYTYVDAAHSGWLGWENNAGHAVETFVKVAQQTKKGFASIDGFITNTANTTPLVEPFLPNVNQQIGGASVRSSSFYEWNLSFDETDWTADLHRRLVAAGFPASTGMLIDTSRNGWGGPDRPTAPSTSSDLNTFVNESRVDRRGHRGAWCNASGAGIGERPQTTPSGFPASHLDAFVWIKPPGESDGSASEIPNDEGKGFDRMCDPTFHSPKLDGQLTGAKPGAPVSGKWFSAQFQELVANAYPVITSADALPFPGGEGPGETPDPDPTDEPDPDPTDEPDPDPTDEPDPDPTDTPDPGDAVCSAAYRTTGDWGAGFQGEIVVTAHEPITSWTLNFDLGGATTTNLWGGQLLGSGPYTVSNESWNGYLSADGTTTIGFIGNGAAPSSVAVSCD
ncbi:glycoside hydrolase family 6 protein [Populibacterium corticicola]|uniref:Glucanase n=1 Tax=Populibacterium corticicola TaxID=1812826 RepID=A0ABW5XEE5_9MICO